MLSIMKMPVLRLHTIYSIFPIKESPEAAKKIDAASSVNEERTRLAKGFSRQNVRKNRGECLKQETEGRCFADACSNTEDVKLSL